MAFNWQNWSQRLAQIGGAPPQTPAPVHAGVPPTQFQPVHPAVMQLAQHIAHAADVSQQPQQYEGYQYLIGNPHAPVGGAGGPAPSSYSQSPFNPSTQQGPPSVTTAPPPTVGSTVSAVAPSPPVGSATPDQTPSVSQYPLPQGIAQRTPIVSNPGMQGFTFSMGNQPSSVADYAPYIAAGLSPSYAYNAATSGLDPRLAQSLGYNLMTSKVDPTQGQFWVGPEAQGGKGWQPA